ncbi:MAG: sulfatase-like hydrolase/transferase [Planctomycetes bacterium]|nr:sulfatase-like hydrolase/transferase [Planctomycetota bacterium]
MRTEKTPSRPNVLVFFCDQLRLDLLGCYGGALVRTPNIDALARESVVFDRAYTPTPICSPARASLLTGLYPHSHHMFNNSTPGYSYCEHLRPGISMIQGWADDVTGYETAYYGKWHIGPAKDLFSSRFHHTHPRPHDGGPRFLSDSHWHPGTYLGSLVQSLANGKAGTVDCPMDEFPDVYAARRTQEFFRNRDTRRSFLAFCAFPGPHSPWMVPEEFGIRYDPDAIPMWPNRYDTFEGKPINQRKLRLLEKSPDSHCHMPGGDRELQERLACCFSYIELIDTMVGEVVSGLKELGLYDDTVIILTADHGDMAGSHGLISKGAYMYDEIVRIPLLVKPAGEAAPRRIQSPVHLMDLTATFLHLMSGEEQETMGGQELHGQSLLPLIEGAKEWPRKVHYGEYHGDWYGHYSSRMVTDGRWKLVWNLTDLCELYDLEIDPAELRNLFYDPAHRETRDHYMTFLIEEAARLGDAHPELYVPAIEDELHQALEGPLELG